MKRVIKNGNTFQSEIKNFTCSNCGCEFITNEYKINYSYDNKIGEIIDTFYIKTFRRKKITSYESICPECKYSTLKYIPKEEQVWIEE